MQGQSAAPTAVVRAGFVLFWDHGFVRICTVPGRQAPARAAKGLIARRRFP